MGLGCGDILLEMGEEEWEQELLKGRVALVMVYLHSNGNPKIIMVAFIIDLPVIILC